MKCEGWRRYGGAFTLGPVRWEQCKGKPTVVLTVKQDGELRKLPACTKCWVEALDKKLEIVDAVPLTGKRKT